MVKIKKKTRVSAYVGEEMGEWLREYAFKKRIPQGEAIRQALKLLQNSTTKARVLQKGQ